MTYSERIMKIARSPLFTIAALCSAIGLAASLAACFVPVDWEAAYLPLLAEYGQTIDGDLNGVMQIFMALCGMISGVPAILIICGLVTMIFSSAKETLFGVGAVKAGIIVNIAYNIVTLLAFVVIAVIVGLLGEIEFLLMFLSFAVAIMIPCVFGIIYLVSMLSCIKAVKDAVLENTVSKKPPMFTAVINFIIGGIGLLNVPSMLATKTALVYSELGFFYDAISSLLICATIALVAASVGVLLFGFVIVKARHALQEPIAPQSVCVPEAEEAKPTHYCGKCGRGLYGDETCDCDK